MQGFGKWFRLFAAAALLTLALSLEVFAGDSKPPASAPPDTFYVRDLSILGWKNNGHALLFREKTRSGTLVTQRAAVLDTRKGEVLRNIELQQPQDSLKDVSRSESNLKDFYNKENFKSGTPAYLFAAGEWSGFLSPDGRYLISADFSYRPTVKNKDLQILTARFYWLPLDGGEKQEIARMEIESLDGEHALSYEAIGAVAVTQLEWSPEAVEEEGAAHKTRYLAVVLEEKRALYRVKGVVTLALPDFVMSERVATTDSSKKTDLLAPSASKKALSTSSNSTAMEASLKNFFLPRGGEAQYLHWEETHRATSDNGSYTALQHYFQACVNEEAPLKNKKATHIISSDLTVFDAQHDAALNFSFSPKLNPNKLAPSWKGDTVEVSYLDEPFKTFSLVDKKLSSPDQSLQSFAIQIGSFTNKKIAASKVKQLCAQGLPAYYLVSNDTNQEHYRLRVGRFDSEAKARHYAAAKIKRKFPKYLVTRF